MTSAERSQKAVDGMRVRNDELGRGPSHDEVETLLCKTLDEAGHGEAEVRALAVQARIPTHPPPAAVPPAARGRGLAAALTC